MVSISFTFSVLSIDLARTDQRSEAADTEERPAKRIKVEHCSSEEVSKITNPFLI